MLGESKKVKDIRCWVKGFWCRVIGKKIYIRLLVNGGVLKILFNII